MGENVGIGEIVGVFEAFVSEPENIEARLVAVDEFFVNVGSRAHREKTPNPFGFQLA